MNNPDKELKSLLKKALSGNSSVEEVQQAQRKKNGNFALFWKRKDGTFDGMDANSPKGMTREEMESAAGAATPFILTVKEREDV